MFKDIALLLVGLASLSMAEGLKCQNCYSANSQACLTAPDCEADFCLYEQIVQSGGRVYIRKTCATSDSYRFDDGVAVTQYNQCVTKTTGVGQYYIMLCNSGDYCNTNCVTRPPVQPTTLAPIGPVPAGGPVTCYNCETTDGTDCQSATCQGAYCLYERRLSGNQMFIKKSCIIEPLILLDDNTAVEGVDICEVRNTATSRYFVKICNDVHFCNNYCSPGQSPTIPPQRQPLVTCFDCEGYGNECFTGSCQANYCIYELQRRLPTGLTYIKKTCSALPFVEYPDNTPSTTINQCEYRTINDIEYHIKVCNSAANCNTACPATPGQVSVVCTSCQANNQDDCSGGTCQGAYCIFSRQKTTSGSLVKKSCANEATLSFGDNSPYTDFSHCQFKNVNGVSYALKACNSSLCNTACADGDPGYNTSNEGFSTLRAFFHSEIGPHDDMPQATAVSALFESKFRSHNLKIKGTSPSIRVNQQFDSSRSRLLDVMGQSVSRDDFIWTLTEQPHMDRREIIVKKYPEIKKLFGVDPSLKYVVSAMVLFQVFMCWLLQDADWTLVLLESYLCGGVINHAMTLAIHDISHNTAFGNGRPLLNRFFGMFANLPIAIPISVSFKKYHVEHHRYLGEDGLDTDVPTELEAKFFTSPAKKLLWLALQPLFYGFRPLIIYKKAPTDMEIVNFIIQIAFDLLILRFFGLKSLIYLVFGTLIAMGLHPSAGHFISEHYAFSENQETYSYYGAWNLCTFNVGYHVEHHDFPYIPGRDLPKLRQIAPEYYETLEQHHSMMKILRDFVFEPTMGPYARLKRKPRAPQQFYGNNPLAVYAEALFHYTGFYQIREYAESVFDLNNNKKVL
ncbi:unnamed protein product [Caenorhabditis auriculariae]|uniref:sphingolipid 4-desaturase n=1 Tax=Caenorhabditis auriculariae TaxID=2777116 RepID=A0A8S1HH25_9PELO|nr:unnamed protein product [Caenorhabditis auriculariae]